VTKDCYVAGVDDIMIAPFSPEELCCAAAGDHGGLHGRATAYALKSDCGIEIDIPQPAAVTVSDVRTDRDRAESLYLLAANGGRLLTRDEIWIIWGRTI